MLPKGASGKKYFDETTRLCNLLVKNIPYESIALKAVHVMSALLLQKPCKFSRLKEHLEALTRQSGLWSKGRTVELLCEGQCVQDCLKVPEKATNISKISKKIQKFY